MIKIAYVAAHIPSYLAEEYNVFSESVSGLENLSAELGFELIVSESPIVTRDEARAVADSFEDNEVDFVLFQHASFAMGDLILEFINRNFRVGIWATEEPKKDGPIPLNNFVSMNLQAGILTRYLKKLNIPFKWFYGSVNHKWFRPRLEVTIRAIAAIKCLQNTTIGLVGGIAPTFYNIAFDERELLTRWGIKVQSHELSELFARAHSCSQGDITTTKDAMSKAGKVEISDRDLDLSARIYLGMKKLAKDYKLDALAVSDWPVFQSELKIHPGMAFSWLDEDDGIPVSSEGDVLGAASMLMMNAISQDKSMLLDINDVDEERNAMLMWHCGGSPLNFANHKGVRWTNHTTLGRKSDDPPMGAVADLEFAEQDGTIFRLADDGKQMFVVDASIIDSPHKGFDGSRGWLSNFKMAGEDVSLGDVVNTIMVEGIEHHFILAKGHHEAVVQEVAAWLGINIINVQEYKNYLQRPALM